jgi:hypothetical protein
MRMRRFLMSVSVIFGFLILVTACKKTNEVLIEEGIFGKWQLKTIKDLKTNNLIVVPETKKVIVAFLRNGIIEETYENTSASEYGFVGVGSSFDLDGNNSMRVYNSSSASPSGYLYEIITLKKSDLVFERETGQVYSFVRMK